ncbi:uncharacterized protein LOC131443875 [Solea solea]|uniref:uncharacterized protein LOC131443875 n=1 Tax=Solea solea TaxID=90069 RepID=UPI00272AB368|nr:uncharacterized protein LOC131443875 [Solea solea]XP_058469912.1 uncharacterized protein LOC131443875 [Solea solea]
MAETSLDAYSVATTLLKSAVAGFAFGEAALITLKPALMEDVVLLNAAARAAGRASSTGVGVVTSCLMFTSVLISLGSGFLFAAVVMKLSAKVGGRLLWWAEATAGASVVVGAVTTGVLVGILPPWIYFAGQAILVLAVYSCSNINDMTTALLIIFTTLYLSVTYGRMGVLVGLFFMGLTISALCALRKALTERMAHRPKAETRCQLLERIVFYCVFVGILGFSVGLVAGEANDGSEAEVVLMLQSVLWVVFLSAGLLGGGLGTVAMVGVGTEVAGKVAMGAAIISSVSLRIILQSSSTLEARGNIGGTLGAAAAAGVSLGAASVAAKQSFGSRRSTLLVLCAVVVGVILAVQGVALKATPLTTCELLTVTFVAVGTFVLGAPKSPFHTHVNLQRGLLTGPDLIKAIGMETVTAAAAPIGAGALGAAVLGTAALGRLGSVGVLVAILLACGSTLSGRIGKSQPTASAHRD